MSEKYFARCQERVKVRKEEGKVNGEGLYAKVTVEEGERNQIQRDRAQTSLRHRLPIFPDDQDA